jgi:diketogulonate reductase-like aldo/keto reductase
VIPTITLNNGVEMPRLGFGVFQIPPAEVFEKVEVAIDAGYRLIDTAAAYGNEAGTGKAIVNSGLPRSALFVTTKVWNNDHGYDSALRAFDTSLAQLGLDVVDLYLVHWPAPRQDRYVETWRALEKLYRDGRVRSIGVSNFTVAHLRRLLDETDIVPAVNQIELHPGFAQPELRRFHAEHGIVTEAWSPLGQGRGLLEEPTVRGLADRYGRTPAQIVLRWHLQLDVVAIPKSVTAERIRSNADVFDFALDEADVALLSGMQGRRLGPDPERFG